MKHEKFGNVNHCTLLLYFYRFHGLPIIDVFYINTS